MKDQLDVQRTTPSLIPTREEVAKVKSTDTPFLPAIKLLQQLSSEVDQPENESGDFYFASKNLNLKKEVEIVVCGRRSHALLVKDSHKGSESFDINSPIFKDIQHTKDDRANSVVVYYGYGDWLLFLPVYNEFVTYFCGRPSSRPVTDDILDHLTEIASRPDGAKDKPQTNRFTLYSHWETKRWGPKFKSMVPKITPLEPWSQEDFAKNIPGDILKSSREMFFAPVLNETSVEVTETEDDR